MRLMKYGDYGATLVPAENPARRLTIPEQIQNHSQRDDKYGRKLISNEVFEEIRGSVKKDTSLPVVKATQRIHELCCKLVVRSL